MTAISLTPLGNIATLQAGVGFPLDLQGRSSGDYPLAKVGDISRVARAGEIILIRADHYIDEMDLVRLQAKPIPAGSILFSKIGEAIRQNHRVIAGCPLLIDNNAMAAIPSAHVESRFLYHFLRTVDLYELASATTVPALRKSELERLLVPLPTLPEQRRIAEILDKADALRAKRRAALVQLDALIRSIFLDMFGDPVLNPRGFPIKTLAEFYISGLEGTRCGPFGSALKKGELVTSGIPVWNMDNIDPSGRMILPFRMWITQGKYKQLEAYAVSDGDVIVSRAGTVGKMCVARSGVPASIISTNLIRIRFGPDLLPTYFVSLMTHCRGRVGRLRTGPDGAFTHMNTSILDGLTFPYPPLKLQYRFAVIVEYLEGLRSQLLNQTSKLDSFFTSIQERAFRGEL